MVMLSSLHIEIHDAEIRIHAIAAENDEDSNAIFVLTPEQAYELAQKLMVSAQVSAKHRSSKFAN